MRIESCEGRAFPYIRYACRPCAGLRLMTLQDLGAMVFGGVSLATAVGTTSSSHFGRGATVTFVAMGLAFLFGPMLRVLALAGADVFPNRVEVRAGATVIRREVASAENVVAAVVVVLFGVMGYANTFMDSMFSMERYGPAGLIVGPICLVVTGGSACFLVASLFRRIRMTPEYLEYRKGFTAVTISWDDLGEAITTNDIKDHQGSRKYETNYLPGAKIAIPEAMAESTRLPVWRDGTTHRLLLETDGFRVEPSALLTAILAMRDHPEFRPALGTRASKAYFTGPPLRVRREMYRNQVWWPQGSAPEGVIVDANGVVEEAR